jgi:hypothetical protein
MGAKRKNGGTIVGIVLVLVVLAFLLAGRLQPTAAEAAGAVEAVGAVGARQSGGPEATVARSVFGNARCGDDPYCKLQNAEEGINAMPPSMCKVLHIDKYQRGVALFTNSGRTMRLQPIAGKIGEVSVGANNEAEPPYFVFSRSGPVNENTFELLVGDKYVRFGESGAAELGPTPSPMQVLSGKSSSILVVGVSVVGGVLKRGTLVTLYVGFPVADQKKRNMCTPGADDDRLVESFNRVWFEREANASKALASMHCNTVAEWAKKPKACDMLCERAFPDDDPPWCAWAARVDPTVASWAENAGVCCRTHDSVKRKVPKVRKDDACPMESSEMWVKVPYANGAFGGSADRQIEIPAYATIALRLSHMNHFSAC